MVDILLYCLVGIPIGVQVQKSLPPPPYTFWVVFGHCVGLVLGGAPIWWFWWMCCYIVCSSRGLSMLYFDSILLHSTVRNSFVSMSVLNTLNSLALYASVPCMRLLVTICGWSHMLLALARISTLDIFENSWSKSTLVPASSMIKVAGHHVSLCRYMWIRFCVGMRSLGELL